MLGLHNDGVTAALAEPTTAPPLRWVGALVLLNLGVTAGFFGPIQVLLAEQSAVIAAGPSTLSKEAILSIVLAAGAAVSMLANPVWGALSDRTLLRVGRRVPWVVAGVLAGALALLLTSQTGSLPTLLLGWCLVQLTLNAAWAAGTAAVPDQVPAERRGLVGGLVAVAGTVGVLVGVKIAEVTGSIASGYAATGAVMVLLAVPYALGSRDLALPEDHPREPLRLGALVHSFWVSPREHPDFAWAWLTRLLVNLGNWIALNYLYYFLSDVLGFSTAESDNVANARLGVLVLIYGVTTVVTAAVVGHLSDRVGRRKVFVIWSGVVTGLAALVLAVSQTWAASIVAAVVLGCGFGIYQAVDFALITQVLPEAAGRAKDLGVINIAASLPQVLAPVIAGGVLILVRSLDGSVATRGDGWSLGYGVLYLLSFGICLLGSVLVTRIRSVR